MINTITFFSTDPPLKSKGSGISVLLYSISTAVQTRYKVNILTFYKDSPASVNDINEDNKNTPISIIDRSLGKIYSLVKFGKLKTLVQFFGYILRLSGNSKSYNRADNLIITFVGASIIPVIYAWLLMYFTRKAKHALYIVDDLELINRKQKNRIELFLIKLFLGRTIKKADSFITISEGLRALYLKQYGKDSVILLPHFEKKDVLENRSIKTEFCFLFTGGLNLLYNDSLKLFAKALEKLNQTMGNTVIEYKLLIQTYSPKSEFDKLNFNPKYVSYNTTNDRSELYKVYEKIDCFLVPYSFSAADKGMVITSFPQKTAEIIQYGKKILVFGPAYSSVSQFFVKNNLPFLCAEHSLPVLIQSITKVVSEEIDISNYLSAYDEHLSSKAVVRLFNDIVINLR